MKVVRYLVRALRNALMPRDRNYQRSQAFTAVDFKPSPKAKALAEGILQSASTSVRQKLGEALLADLSRSATIPLVTLKISAAHQYYKKRGTRVTFKRYGYYRPKSHYIYINNKTAVRGQILAPKTFLNTLLHEWMHHYDYLRLHLNSIHTKGFYDRLRSLQNLLLN